MPTFRPAESSGPWAANPSRFLERHLPGDQSEDPVAAPGSDVQVVDEGISLPVPLTRQIQRLAGEVGSNGALVCTIRPRILRSPLEAVSKDPGGLVRGCPMDLGSACPDAGDRRPASGRNVDPRVAHLHATSKNRILRYRAIPRHTGWLPPRGAVEDRETHASDPRAIGADDQPPRKKEGCRWDGRFSCGV